MFRPSFIALGALTVALLGVSHPASAADRIAQANSAPVAQATAPPVAATPAPQATPNAVLMPDGSVQYVFGGQPIPTLACKPLYICDVALEAGETILNIAVGDSVRWIIASGQSGPAGGQPHVFVKPTETSLQTNLIVTTTRRVYNIRLVSTPAGQISRISYTYPEEAAEREAEREAAERRAAEEAAAERAVQLPLVPPEQLDTRYRFTGEKSLQPSSVYNDGVHTYIQFTSLPNDLPVIIAIAQDGSDQIVNFRLSGNTFIVDSLHSGYDLVVNAGTGKHGRGERRAYIRHL